MKYGLTLLSGTSEPITVADLQSHSRIFANDVDNATLSSLITTAREYIEVTTNRQIMPATWLYAIDQFPGRHDDEYRPPGWRFGVIRLPRAPLQTIVSVQYVDAATFVLTTLDSSLYQYSNKREPGVLAPARYQVWPVADPQTFDAVQVTFTAGYTTVPERVKHAVKLLASHLYEHREASIDVALSKIPFGLQQFINSLKVGELP